MHHVQLIDKLSRSSAGSWVVALIKGRPFGSARESILVYLSPSKTSGALDAQLLLGSAVLWVAPCFRSQAFGVLASSCRAG